MNVTVDISNPVEKYGLNVAETNAMMDYVVSTIVDRFLEKTRSGAKRELKQTRQAYLDGLVSTKTANGRYVVELIGFLPNAVEFGCSPFDMKEGFSKSKKKTAKKGGGWYLTIPFRVANPNAVATSTVFSGKLPAEVHALAKKLSGKQSLSKKSLVNIGFGDVGKRAAINVNNRSLPEYVHKSPMYEGLRKENKAGGGHSHYSKFRRVSDKSDPNSWIHTGIPSHRIAQIAIGSINYGILTKMAVDDYLTSIGK